MDLKTKRRLTDTFFPGTDPIIRNILLQSPLQHDKVVVNIAARAGSSRIPKKNIKPLCGKPLMAYSIIMAKSIGVDRVIVSTDSEEFAEIAKNFGAEVPFLRPKKLSTGSTPPGFVTYYMVKRLLLEGYPVGTWVELLPTTPFRNYWTLKKYLTLLERAGNISTAFCPTPPQHEMRHDGQTIRIPNAAALSDSYCFYKVFSGFVGNKLNNLESRWQEYVLVNNPVELLDIDTYEDFLLAEEIILSGCYDFGIDLC
ncbi:Cytidylyltransferase [Paucidesulfovibrio gracilis DSM 16080]|uniref:Cytidylyltransferase n=1 Tax=Paucidesulfovibrio gracilis DSM 16080 TaxID=1121449 RepID=A0A1T4W9Z4_9BACT|nr:hypothetical protein [Paucidesulfovibrio gracilis]SKA73939.1 Cytidylyltransferase [Paucidesulfovibrio gracilis DSM 16080]